MYIDTTIEQDSTLRPKVGIESYSEDLKNVVPLRFLGGSCIFASFDRTSMILRHKRSRRRTLKIFNCFSDHEEAL